MMSTSKRETVYGVFQKIYKNYDFMNSVISFNRHKAWRKTAMSMMNVKSGETALDLCCGTGDWTLALSRVLGKSGRAVGLDFSENMLTIAEDKKSETPFDNISFVHGDAAHLPYDDNSFQYITIGFGLRNVPNYEQTLAEAFRVLKPGGQFVCMETSQPDNTFVRRLYFIYFKRIMPLLGKWLADSYEEYVWLHESTKNFPNKKKLAEMFGAAGFQAVRYQSLTLGTAAVHVGTKPQID